MQENNDANVQMDNYVLSYVKIKTKALSTCIGILLDGSIDDKQFCFLSHSSKLDEHEDDNVEDLLIRLLEDLSSKLMEVLCVNSLSSKKHSINNLKLLIAGGSFDEHILTRKAFSLLNERRTSHVIQKLSTDKNINHLLQELKDRVVIIQPVTYVLSDVDEDKGE
ncbi:unnamed protein product [Rotaria sp. Silwood2]|nr:unnamed protein product [Rotaria sp. Silwood2]CAF3528873.1 unnamed protein product [Rotaria sp. Silwood2]CAF4762326.1 unnamed protein product [Rotaria sp. Silwood2]